MKGENLRTVFTDYESGFNDGVFLMLQVFRQINNNYSGKTVIAPRLPVLMHK